MPPPPDVDAAPARQRLQAHTQALLQVFEDPRFRGGVQARQRRKTRQPGVQRDGAARKLPDKGVQGRVFMRIAQGQVEPDAERLHPVPLLAVGEAAALGI
jgi:hypothetical protein